MAPKGALSACASCCSFVSKKQGAYTYRFKNLRWDNSPKRVEFTCPFKQILFDEDGSLTGHVNGTATYDYKYNRYPGTCDVQGTKFDNGIVCDGSVRVRRLQIDQVDAAGAVTGFLDDKRVGLRQSKTAFVDDSNGGTDMETLHCNDGAKTCKGLNWPMFDQRKGLTYDGKCTKRLLLGADQSSSGICTWTEHKHTYSGGFAKDSTTFTLPDAKKECLRMGEACKAVSCTFTTNNLNSCTLRASSGLSTSSTETTYTAACYSESICQEWDQGHDFINYRDVEYSGWAIPVVTHNGKFLLVLFLFISSFCFLPVLGLLDVTQPLVLPGSCGVAFVPSLLIFLLLLLCGRAQTTTSSLTGTPTGRR